MLWSELKTVHPSVYAILPQLGQALALEGEHLIKMDKRRLAELLPCVLVLIHSKSLMVSKKDLTKSNQDCQMVL